MSAICAGLGSKGKVGVQRGRETAGVPSFLPPRRAPRRSRRPQTANPLLRFSEKLSARKGRTRLRQFECPAGSVQKRSRPVRANTLTQFVCPGQPVQEKEPPVRGEPACGSSSAPVSRCREKSRTVRANPPTAVRVPPVSRCKKKGRTQNLTAKPLQTLFIATR